MIKRILILSLIYAIVILALTLNMDKIGSSYLFLLLIFSVIFAVLLIRFISKKHLIGFKSKNSEIGYVKSQTPNSELKKISTRPFLFGIERKLIDEDELYFDEENLYAINNKQEKATFKLADITELSKTYSQINNRRIWQIKIKQDNETEIVFRFTHNYSIWNKNFSLFYKKLKRINTSAIKTDRYS